jgi:hypothetical protein
MCRCFQVLEKADVRVAGPLRLHSNDHHGVCCSVGTRESTDVAWPAPHHYRVRASITPQMENTCAIKHSITPVQGPFPWIIPYRTHCS